jgi:hypothetical protein
MSTPSVTGSGITISFNTSSSLSSASSASSSSSLSPAGGGASLSSLTSMSSSSTSSSSSSSSSPTAVAQSFLDGLSQNHDDMQAKLEKAEQFLSAVTKVAPLYQQMLLNTQIKKSASEEFASMSDECVRLLNNLQPHDAPESKGQKSDEELVSALNGLALITDLAKEISRDIKNAQTLVNKNQAAISGLKDSIKES